MKAALIVFAYKRADKLDACLRALSAADGCEDTELYVFADGPKGAEDAEQVGQVRTLLQAFVEDSPFMKVHLKVSEKNKGLADSIISGVTEVTGVHDKVIVVEDDLTVTKDFLDYMNRALDFYEKDEKVWSITGFSEPLSALKGYKHDVYYGYRGCSYGWGTWKDRWDTVDWDVKRYGELLADKKMQKRFNRGGNDMVGMLKDQMEGRIDSWAIRWGFEQSLQDRYTVYPRNSFVVNTGTDGTGTHGNTNTHLNDNRHVYGETVKLEYLEPDRRVNRCFYYAHSDTLYKKIRRNMNLNGIRKQIKKIGNRDL